MGKIVEVGSFIFKVGATPVAPTKVAGRSQGH